MIRLLIALLIVGGMAYFLFLNGAGETQRVDVQYKQEVQKIDDMEKKMLQDAEDLQKRVDEMTK